MPFFSKRKKKRALKKIITSLPPFLKKSYGRVDNYTPGQVNQALAQEKCDVRYAQYALAMFCTEEIFNQQELGDYHELRTELANGVLQSNDSVTTSDIGSLANSFGMGDIGGDGGGD